MSKEFYIYVLYIEDERPVIDLVREALKTAGYKVVGATSGRQGLTMMKERKPDLLLLDLMMPDINGWDVYREVKTDKQLADIPVIVVSAKVPDAGNIIIKDLPPVDDYLTKPFDVEDLIRSVNQLLADGNG
jgi:two-component system, OmpR family, response regulator VicR